MMSTFKDICRFCLIENDFYSTRKINLWKLSRLKHRYQFLPSMNENMLRGHILCDICIANLKTSENLAKTANRSNAVFYVELKKNKNSKINLKLLKRYNKLQGNFLVCRLCLEPTTSIALYLYDSPKNILPMEYINSMLKGSRIYINFDKILNPVLCHKCWENLQVSYNFRKQLDEVNEKINLYCSTFSKASITREDLQKMSVLFKKYGMGSELKLMLKAEAERAAKEKFVLEQDVRGRITQKQKFIKRNKAKVLVEEPPILEQIVNSISLSEPQREKNIKNFNIEPPILENCVSIACKKFGQSRVVSHESYLNDQQSVDKTVEQIHKSVRNREVNGHIQAETVCIPVKAEIVSDSDVEIQEHSTEVFDGECPCLESFVKNEPVDIDLYDIQMIEEVDIGPPELELQIPPSFSDTNVCVSRGMQVIPTIDEKRSLLKKFSMDMNKELIVNISNCDQEIKRKQKSRKAVAKESYTCVYCDFKAKSMVASVAHRAKHLNNTIHMYYCNSCNFKCSNAGFLKKHIKRKHFPDSCGKCSKSVKNKVICIKCEKIFHYACFMRKSKNCTHVAEWET